MNVYLRLLSFARPIRYFVVPFFITSVLASLFGVLNFTLLVPLLKVLFNEQDKNGEAMAIPTQLPEASFSIDYPIAVFNYYFGQFAQLNGPIGALKFVWAIIIVSVFISNIFKYISARLLEKFKVNLIARLRERVFDNAVSLDLSFFGNERKGNLMARVITDVQEVENSVAQTFSAVFKEVFTLIIYLIVLFKTSVSLTLFAFLIIPISGTFIAFIVKRMRKEAKEGQKRISGLISLMDEVFGGMRVVKAFNAENYIRGKFVEENRAYRKAVKAMAYRREMSPPFSEFMGVLMVALILLYGGSMVLDHTSDLNPSEFISYIVIFSQVMRPAKEISNAFGNTQRGIAAGERVLELIDTENTINEKQDAVSIDQFNDSITVQNVEFAYNADKKVLNGINFELKKGRTIALVGASGGGKSTFADLIPRFYDPTKGSIAIDGKDLRDVTLRSLRGLMGIVTQEAILFNDTIFNNIAFGTNATEEEVVRAAKIANAHQFITDQPEAYQTIIGDRGGRLSGGQRQRISIARAVLKNPPILILDEATSALDTESEKLVQEALIHLMHNRTVLVIAHRLSTIQHADEILVLHQGEIVERGTHESLLAVDGGFYRKLTATQST